MFASFLPNPNANVVCLLDYDSSSEVPMAEAKKNSWTVVSVKDKWKTIFPPAGR